MEGGGRLSGPESTWPDTTRDLDKGRNLCLRAHFRRETSTVLQPALNEQYIALNENWVERNVVRVYERKIAVTLSPKMSNGIFCNVHENEIATLTK